MATPAKPAVKISAATAFIATLEDLDITAPWVCVTAGIFQPKSFDFWC
jgi:hypothetical protein